MEHLVPCSQAFLETPEPPERCHIQGSRYPGWIFMWKAKILKFLQNLSILLFWPGAALIDPSRIAMAGFSDGASYSLSVGLANGDLFSAVFGFSPGLAR